MSGSIQTRLDALSSHATAVGRTAGTLTSGHLRSQDGLSTIPANEDSKVAFAGSQGAVASYGETMTEAAGHITTVRGEFIVTEASRTLDQF